jgi:hypothetical protein
MAMLLPPQVVGPVYVNSASVGVTGAKSGAQISLYQDGQFLNSAPADMSGNAAIALGAGQLQEKAQLTATQSEGQEISEPSRFPEPVLPLPDVAPALAILSHVHPCMDAVLVGGVVYGALVELFHGAKLLGIQGGYGSVVYIPRQAPDPLMDGDVLTVRQSYVNNGQTLVSPTVNSLPLQSLVLPPAEDDRYLLPSPTIDGPLFECCTAVTVRGILPGASLQLFNGTQNESYWYSGHALNIGVPPLKDGMKLNATQQFNSCSQTSQPSPDAPVVKRALSYVVIVHQPICPNPPRIALSNLEPGALVTIAVRRSTGQGQTAYHYWEATAATETQTFDLPTNLQGDWDGPPEEITAFQKNCLDVGGPTPQWVAFEPAGASSATLGPLTECQRRVRVNVDKAGVSVRLASDRTPALAAPAMVYGPYVEIDLYRGLFAGETVTATVSACGSGPDVQATGVAKPLTQLAPPVVSDPVREWMTNVHVRSCTPGARVHVYVNKVWRQRRRRDRRGVGRRWRSEGRAGFGQRPTDPLRPDLRFQQ